MYQPSLDDDEEDFLALVDSEEKSVKDLPQIAVQPDTVDLSSDEHLSLSEIQTGHETQNGTHEGTSLDNFKSALYDFYARYNFGNLDKIPYLAEKFYFRRWELWKQLSMKYNLSPRESAELWTRFNVRFDGVPECARRLFGSHETVVINSDSRRRRELWVTLLSVTADNHREQYKKHSAEIEERKGTIDLSATQPIHLDVIRTHQELSFFQEVRYVSTFYVQ
jgi:hypothetical protein